MGIISEFWRAFMEAFQAARQGQGAADVAPFHGADSQSPIQDDDDAQRIAKLWAAAKTPNEQQAAAADIAAFVLRGTDHPKVPSRPSHELDWSADPGAYEAHLKRRFDNPYFPPPRRGVSVVEISIAKEKDRVEFETAKEGFNGIVRDLRSIGDTADFSDIDSMRGRVDDLIHFCAGAGGAARAIASKTNQIRDYLILAMRDALSDDSEALEMISKADYYHKDNVSRFDVPFIAQMLIENGPIPDDELIPSFVSQDPIIMSIALEVLSDPDSTEVRVAALSLINQTLIDGYRDPDFDQKLAVLAPP